MSGRIVILGIGPHDCAPFAWSNTRYQFLPPEAKAPMGTVWRCDCGKTWKRVPRPRGLGEKDCAPFWRPENLLEKFARTWRGRV